MFKATEWSLVEPDIADSAKYDLLIPTVVKPEENELYQDQPEIGIIHRYQFSSSLQRMSVITRDLNSSNFNVFCKGSPEMVMSLSKSSTIPEDIAKHLKEYTEKGYRVIALATKQLHGMNYVKATKLSREEVETDLDFVGLIILENRLKPQTTSVIRELRDANIKVIMITGNVLLHNLR